MMQMANVFNVLAILAACATAALQWYGVELSYFWTVWWWDIPAHFFGGLTVGLWAVAVAIRLGIPPKRAVLWMLGFILCVGIAWEIWEVLVQTSGGMLDSLKDLIDDTLGTAVAWVLYKALNKTGRMW